MTDAVIASPTTERPKSKGLGRVFLRRVISSWQGKIAVTVLLIVILAGILAPVLTPFSPTKIDFNYIITEPTSLHWFGTDEAGRDTLTRVLYGARTSMVIVVLAVAIGAAMGTLIGLISGWVGGIVDTAIMRAMDVVLCFPTLVLALAIVSALGPDTINAIIALALVQVPHFARLCRAEVLSLRNIEYIKAVRAMGASVPRIVFLHVWPNASGPIIVYLSTAASITLMAEASLSFLGLGVQPPTPSWGNMVAVGMNNVSAWWMSIFPGAAIFVTVLGFNLLGDAVRDARDARLS